MTTEHFDIVIVGAGLSGISAAYHFQKYCPNKSYIILEGRENMGGTWDLFRYPGIRSDSDMYTLGYSFRPWPEAKAIADGASILKYIKSTASDNGIEKHIRYNHKVTGANWSSPDSKWTLEIEEKGEKKQISCNFTMGCSGYYSYEAGYTPEFEGRDSFLGTIVHPQKWPEDLDYSDKKVVVIGSGATAVTLVPAMAGKTKHITMLQRSPTYVAPVPSRDKIADTLRKWLPSVLAYRLVRAKNVGFGIFFYNLSKKRPEAVKKLIRKSQEMFLGKDFDYETHFTPKYNPWDERLCAVTDGDLFRVLKKGKASIVTDHIDRFTEKGIKLKSGKELEADIIITATGLNLNVFGGMDISVDGETVDFPTKYNYKGMMLSDVPNAAMTLGYTNASWTLKSDLTCRYVCRLINHMDKNNLDYCVPIQDDPSITDEPLLDFKSGYVLRAINKLPKQGSKAPWKLYQNYIFDLLSLKYGSVKDNYMSFKRSSEAK